MVKSRCFFMLLFVSSLCHFQLRLFMLLFLGLYCISKVRIWLNHDAFLLLLIRIVFCLNRFQLPLINISNVNNKLLRQFLCFYCVSKLIMC